MKMLKIEISDTQAEIAGLFIVDLPTYLQNVIAARIDLHLRDAGTVPQGVSIDTDEQRKKYAHSLAPKNKPTAKPLA